MFRINPGDSEKIGAAQKFVRDHVDMDVLLPLLEDAAESTPEAGKRSAA